MKLSAGTNAMNKISPCLLLVCLILTGCSYSIDITHDPCFQGLAEKQVVTKNAKRKLRLYGSSYADHDPEFVYTLTTVDQGKDNLIGFVPPGSPVIIKEIYEHHDIGGASKDMLGQLQFRGKTYPFRFFLGTYAYPEGWRRIFDSFEPR